MDGIKDKIMYPQQIIDALRNVKYPGTGKDLVESGMLEDDIRISGFEVSFSLVFKKDTDPFLKSVLKASQVAIQTYVEPNAVVHITPRFVTQHNNAEKVVPSYNHFKQVIAIHSGKGGVGKSTVTANLAIALAQQGYKVGILDADIYGPTIPKMFGVEDYTPLSTEEQGKTMIEPAEKYGVSILSIGFFVNSEQAIVWRGAMASNAIQQLITDGHWGELDYLLIDLPPGTSDIHLTILQNLSLSGVIVVTTPQSVAFSIARKGIDMFQNEKINVPIIGIIENMAWFTPAELPNNKYYIFGKEGGKQLAEALNIPLLAQIPLIQSIQENGEQGTPIVLRDETIKQMYQDILCHIQSPN